jgi:hypothetical protein
MTLQCESGTLAIENGLSHLIEAFPDDDDSFDVCGYLSGRIGIFLRTLPGGKALPPRGQVAGVLQQLAGQVSSGRTAFTLELDSLDRIGLHRLAGVFVEATVDGVPRTFPLLEDHREERGRVGVCVSQGFSDLALGRWEPWGVER